MGHHIVQGIGKWNSCQKYPEMIIVEGIVREFLLLWLLISHKLLLKSYHLSACYWMNDDDLWGHWNANWPCFSMKGEILKQWLVNVPLNITKTSICRRWNMPFLVGWCEQLWYLPTPNWEVFTRKSLDGYFRTLFFAWNGRICWQASRNAGYQKLSLSKPFSAMNNPHTSPNLSNFTT